MFAERKGREFEADIFEKTDQSGDFSSSALFFLLLTLAHLLSHFAEAINWDVCYLVLGLIHQTIHLDRQSLLTSLLSTLLCVSFLSSLLSDLLSSLLVSAPNH